MIEEIQYGDVDLESKTETTYMLLCRLVYIQKFVAASAKRNDPQVIHSTVAAEIDRFIRDVLVFKPNK